MFVTRNLCLGHTGRGIRKTHVLTGRRGGVPARGYGVGRDHSRLRWSRRVAARSRHLAIIDSELEDLPQLCSAVPALKNGGSVQYLTRFINVHTSAHAPAGVHNGTMRPSVSYHSPCPSTNLERRPPVASSSSYDFNPLHELLFCEERDAVRCNCCVSVEVSGFYCPNRLFEGAKRECTRREKQMRA
ncbi:hypothetical protein BJV77DRAFT_212392 [Russula vinacea]|nr:hypothetical protein BJV77DRAFT_212392 [Russula vinacea]